jgi:alpha-galactosidase
VNIDPDVMFFRSKMNWLRPHENQLLQDLGNISGFKATSDLPQWLSGSDKKMLREYLNSASTVQKKKRYQYQINQRDVDFAPAVPLEISERNTPIWLAKNLGLLKIACRQALPAILQSWSK